MASYERDGFDSHSNGSTSFEHEVMRGARDSDGKHRPIPQTQPDPLSEKVLIIFLAQTQQHLADDHEGCTDDEDGPVVTPIEHLSDRGSRGIRQKVLKRAYPGDLAGRLVSQCGPAVIFLPNAITVEVTKGDECAQESSEYAKPSSSAAIWNQRGGCEVDIVF